MNKPNPPDAILSAAAAAAFRNPGFGRTPPSLGHNRAGYFGEFGGQFAAETLMPALSEVAACYDNAKRDPAFGLAYAHLLQNYVGRPTPLFFAARLSAECGGAKIYLKREDLNHTGAHKINNAIGQALLAERMGKRRIIAETGAGQHGVATAAACALFGFDCIIFMGAVDIERQAPNVARMKLFGAQLVPVETGSRTLKDAVSAALQEWTATVETSHYMIGSAIGPHPFPTLVRDFQSVIGHEARQQILAETNRLPDQVIACVGGGSNAVGMFAGFAGDPDVHLTGVQAAGDADHASPAPLIDGSPGVLHGTATYLVQDENGQISATHSIAPGLDYPGVGPEHAYLKNFGHARYIKIDDQTALAALHHLARSEGILSALESAHAVAEAIRLAPTLNKDSIILVNLSGRGDKDLGLIAGINHHLHS